MNVIKNAFMLAALLFVAATYSFAQEKKESEMKKDSVGVKEASINLPTMKCGQCKKTITGALKTVEGVKEVSVDLKNKKAMIKFVDSKVNLNDLRQAVARAGYDADDVKRDSTGYSKLDDCCK